MANVPRPSKKNFGAQALGGMRNVKRVDEAAALPVRRRLIVASRQVPDCDSWTKNAFALLVSRRAQNVIALVSQCSVVAPATSIETRTICPWRQESLFCRIDGGPFDGSLVQTQTVSKTFRPAAIYWARQEKPQKPLSDTPPGSQESKSSELSLASRVRRSTGKHR